jgi:neural Wiskott-Aldrich syndrome protein
MTILRQAGGLALAAAVAAGSYGVKIDRSAGTPKSASYSVIQPAPERRVALRAFHAQRRTRRAGRPARSSTTRQSASPPPGRELAVARTHPLATRTVEISAPIAAPPAHRRGPCRIGPRGPSPFSSTPYVGPPRHPPRVDVEPAPHDPEPGRRVDAPAQPDPNAPPPASPTPTAPPPPQAPLAPQPPSTMQPPAPPPTSLPGPSNPPAPPVSPPPAPPADTPAPPETAPTPPAPPPPAPGTLQPVPPETILG